MAQISCHILSCVLELFCIFKLTGGLLGTGKVQSRCQHSAENVSFLHYRGSHVGDDDRCGNRSSNTPVDSNGKDKWKLTDIIIHFFTPL